ncbi:MAG: hypothetical protein WA160_11755 [Pseudobdellovibrio sp.]
METKKLFSLLVIVSVIGLMTSNSKAQSLTCRLLFSENSAIHVAPTKSSIADYHFDYQTSVIHESNVVIFVPYKVTPEHTEILGRTLWSKTKNSSLALLGLNKQPSLGPLSVKALPEKQLTNFSGIVEKGSTQTIKWQIPPTKLSSDYIKYNSRFTGLQISMDLQQHSETTSLVIFANIPDTQNSGMLKQVQFIGKIPAKLKTKLQKDQASSFVFDFDQLFLYGDTKGINLADIKADAVITGFGLIFNAKDIAIKVDGTLFGEIHLITDILKDTNYFRKHLHTAPVPELVREFMKTDFPYISIANLVKLSSLVNLAMNKSGMGISEFLEFSKPMEPIAGFEEKDLIRYFKLEKFVLDNQNYLSLLNREVLISFFLERVSISKENKTVFSRSGKKRYLNNNWEAPPSSAPKAMARLYSHDRQKETLKILKINGAEFIISYLKEKGFDSEKIGLTTFEKIWNMVAPYNRDTNGRFGIPMDIDVFGNDHGEISHVLQIFTIVRDMDEMQLNEFKNIFKRMQSGQSVFNDLWTYLFDAAGSATPNSPRYWRDLVHSN